MKIVVATNASVGAHIHKPGCADLTKRRYYGYDFEDHDVPDLKAIIFDFAGSILDQYPDEPDEWKSYIDDYKVFPCAGLPVEAGA